MYEALVEAYCDDDDNKNEAAKEPCKEKVSQPTPEEIRLQIEAANEMEAFWTTVLAGSVAAGAGYFAPGLLPAAVPYIPQLVPQYAR